MEEDLDAMKIDDEGLVRGASLDYSMDLDLQEDTADLSPMVLSWGRSDNGTLLKSSDDMLLGISKFKRAHTTIRQIASGSYHTACLTATGDLMLCGSNDEAQVTTDLCPENELVMKPRLFDGVGTQRVSSVSVGLYHTVCVTSTGVALSFGGNEVGQLGHSASKLSKVPPSKVDFRVKGKNPLVVQSAVCGELFTLFLTTSGEVYHCGSGDMSGNLGTSNSNLAERVESLGGSNIVSISAGSSHAMALSSAGEVYAWGSNHHGQLGIDPTRVAPKQSVQDVGGGGGADDLQVRTPTIVKFPESVGKVIGISCGYSHSLAWTDKGVLLGAGSNKYGQVGVFAPRVTTFEPVALPVDTFCTMADCGNNHSVALCLQKTAEGTDVTKLYGFGANNFQQVKAESTMSLYRQPTEITELGEGWGMQRILYIAAGGDQTFAVGLPDGNGVADEVLMRKQFSTRMSQSTFAMNAQDFLQTLSAAHTNERLVSSAISTACELFSSSSLLAGSFFDESADRNRLSIDIAGLEACYVALLHLGHAAVTRLVVAMQQTCADLEAVINTTLNSSNSTSASSSSSSGSTSVPSTSKPKGAGNDASSGQPTLPESVIRTLLILWHCPINANAVLSTDLFPRINAMICKIAPASVALESRSIILETLKVVPAHIFASRYVKPLQEHLKLAVQQQSSQSMEQGIPLLCVVLNWLFTLNQQAQMVPNEIFYNEGISSLPDQVLFKDFNQCKMFHLTRSQQGARSMQARPGERIPFFLSNHPHLISVDAKRRMLLYESVAQMQIAQQQSVQQGFMMSGGQGFQWMPYFVLNVNRAHLLQQAIVQIASASDLELKKPLKVIFEGEEGIDEGGVRKEFFQLLTGQLFGLDYAMFLPTPDGRSLWINPSCNWSQEEYTLVGVLLGLAVYNGILLDIHLPKLFYKLILRRALTLDDLATFDPELQKGLQQLLAYEPASDIEDVFCRTFEIEWTDSFGEKKIHELIPNGKNIPVNGDNRKMYAEKYMQYLLVESTSSQFEQLREGFHRVVPTESMLLLRPDELELLMVGQPHLDFKELQSTTQYVGESDWGPEHPTVKAFWAVVHSLPFEEKQKLLLFVTGSSRAPVGGLKNLGLKLQRMGPDSDSLPTAHTCFNTMLIPEYSSVDKLRDRLLKAISECEGFGLK